MKKLRQNKSPLVSNSRWLAYAAASTASTLAGAHSAEAEIHYSGLINEKLGHGNRSIHENVRLNDALKVRFSERTYSLNFSIGGAAVSSETRFTAVTKAPPRPDCTRNVFV